MKSVLVVDDDRGMRESLKLLLQKHYEVHTADSALKALRFLKDHRIDLILLDIIMPEKDGITFLREVRAYFPDIPVVMLTASAKPQHRQEALLEGAADYIPKPFDTHHLRTRIQVALDLTDSHRRLQILQRESGMELALDHLPTESLTFKKVIDASLKSEGPLLLVGEYGAGKSHIARFAHSRSPSAAEPFLPFPCISLPPNLVMQELFGIETETTTVGGRFDLAGTGTLLLREFTALSMQAQEEIHHLLTHGEFHRPRSSKRIPFSGRLILTASQPLEEELQAGRLHSLLYQKLIPHQIAVPALRDHPEDIPMLAYRFLHEFRQTLNAVPKDFDAETMKLLRRYSWPGNVRELRNLLERMVVTYRNSPVILPDHLPQEFHSTTALSTDLAGFPNFEEAVNAFERKIIVRALTQANGIQAKAAQLLGTTRRILNYRINKLNVRTTAE